MALTTRGQHYTGICDIYGGELRYEDAMTRPYVAHLYSIVCKWQTNIQIADKGKGGSSRSAVHLSCSRS